MVKSLLRNRILLFCLASGLSTVVSGLWAWAFILKEEQEDNWTAYTYRLIQKLEKAQATLLDAETKAQAYVITGEVRYRNEYQKSRNNARQMLTILRRDMEPGQQQYVDSLERFMGQRMNVIDDQFLIPSQNQVTHSALIALGQQYKINFERTISQMRHMEELALKRHQEEIANSLRWINILMASLLIGIVSTMSTLFVVLSKRLKRHKMTQKLLLAYERTLEQNLLELEEKTNLFQKTIDESPMGIALVEAIRDESRNIIDFRVLVINPVCSTAIGLSPADMVGTLTSRYNTSETARNIITKMVEVVETGEMVRKVVKFESSNGVRYLDTFFIPHGNGVLYMFSDITEVRLAQLKEHQFALELRNYLDGSLALVLAVDSIRNQDGQITDFQIRYANEAFYRFINLPKDVPINRSFLSVHPELQHTDIFGRFVRVVDTGEPQRFEQSFVHRGVQRWFAVSALKRGDGFIVSILEITVQKKHERNVELLQKAEQELIAALKREKEMNALKSQFVSMVSHEFRTPMATILSGVEIMEQICLQMDNPEYANRLGRYVNQIRQQILRLNTLISDVLMQERLQSNQLTVRPKDFDLIHFFELLVKRNWANTRVQFTASAEELAVTLDPTLLEHVIENLVNNALKYSVDSDKPVEVNLTMIPDRVRIVVTDYGIGIPETDLQRMGESFFRASNVGNVHGTGLGLALVRQFTQMQGGTFGIESKEGGFTRCTVEMPLAVEKPASFIEETIE